MKIPKKVLLSNFIIIFFLFISNAKSEVKIIAQVGTEIITNYDLKNKIRTILFLTNQELNQQNINNAKNNSIQDLINLKIKILELKKYKINLSIDNIATQNYLKNLSLKFNTDTKGLEKKFLENGLDFNFFKNEVLIEYSWQNLIYNLFKNKIAIDDAEIEIAVKKIINNQNPILSYKLSEIEFFQLSEEENKIKINDILNYINKTSFEKTAVKYSISDTGLNGGEIGWVKEQALSDEIRLLLKNLSVGEISEPLYKTNTILIFKIQDKKSQPPQKIDNEKVMAEIREVKEKEQLNFYSRSYLSQIKSNYLLQIND